MLSEILGQLVAVQVLRNYLAADRVTGSFLFVGPPHVGKAFAAHQFAAALLCESVTVGATDACGECASCRMVAGDRHPDLRAVRPSGASRILRLPQIWPRDGVKEFPADNALLRDLQFSPLRQRRRVFILEDADALNEDTANSLLKVLEEPPAYATFVLTAPSSSAVLPTIFSRCQTVRFQSVPAAVIEAALIERKLADSATARFLSVFAQGQIGAAFTSAADKELRAARETILDIAEKLCQAASPIYGLKLADDLRKIAAKLSGALKTASGDGAGAETSARTATAGALELLASWYRDILALRCDADQSLIVNSDRIELLRIASNRFTQQSAEEALTLILGVRDVIERNANGQIALEALTLHLVGLTQSTGGRKAA